MTTDIEVYNSALDICGVENIISFTEESKAARLGQKNYTKIKNQMLGSHYWNFAMKRIELAKLPDAPVFEFEAAFQLPNDCIRVRRMEDSYARFKVQGRTLLTDENQAIIEYISSDTPPGNFTPMFAELLAYAIANKINYSLVQSVSLRREIKADYIQMLRDTRSFDGQEGDQDMIQVDEFLDARRISVTGEPLVEV